MKELMNSTKGRLAFVGIIIAAIAAWVIPLVIVGIKISRLEWWKSDYIASFLPMAIIWGFSIFFIMSLINWIITGKAIGR